MTIKLKNLVPSKTSQVNQKTKDGGRILFRKFVVDAMSSKHCEDPFWEELRKSTMPTKFKTVPTMFDRWQVLAGIKK